MSALAADAQIEGAGVARHVRARPLLGTVVELTVQGLAQDVAHRAMDQAYADIEAVHVAMSFQSAASELTRLNQRAWQAPVAVSRSLRQVLEAAQEMATASDGLFDVTVASSLVAAGLLPRHAGLNAVPDANWRDVELLSGSRVRFARPLCLDLSGIAKGYAVDRAVQRLQAAGATAGLVNAGGDLRGFGALLQTVRLRHPGAPAQLLPVLALRQSAVATSAHYFSRKRWQGQTALIHPLRRTALDEDISVTVLAQDCMTADALTKVVHADAELAIEALRAFGAEALVLRRAGPTEAWQVHASCPELATAVQSAWHDPRDPLQTY